MAVDIVTIKCLAGWEGEIGWHASNVPIPDRHILGLVALVVVAALGAAVAFAIITDGRYFGKPIVRWLYDRIGPGIFAARSEQGVWIGFSHGLGLRAGDRVLDVGTAVGDLPISLVAQSESRVRAVGLEISMPMAMVASRTARRRGVAGETTFVVADAARPFPFADHVFDCVTALGVLETLRYSHGILEEMDRVLRPTGVLAVSVYKGPSKWVASLTESWYRQHLSQLGSYRCRRIPLRRSHDALVAEHLSTD